MKDSPNQWAARLYLPFWLSRAQQENVFQWPAREDAALPQGFGHVRNYPNTSPASSRDFMHDRGRVERLKGVFEHYIGPVEGRNPNTLDM